MFINCIDNSLPPVPVLNQTNQGYGLHPTSLSSLLIFPSHLCLNLPSGLFPSGFLTKTLYPPLLSLLHSLSHTHLIPLDLSTQLLFGEEYRSYSYSLHSLLCSHYLFPLIPKHLPQHPIPKHFQPMILSQWDQVPNPYKMSKVLVMSILIFIFLDRKLEDKRFCTEW